MPIEEIELFRKTSSDLQFKKFIPTSHSIQPRATQIYVEGGGFGLRSLKGLLDGQMHIYL